jgi:hypothetical protein
MVKIIEYMKQLGVKIIKIEGIAQEPLVNRMEVFTYLSDNNMDIKFSDDNSIWEVYSSNGELRLILTWPEDERLIN